MASRIPIEMPACEGTPATKVPVTCRALRGDKVDGPKFTPMLLDTTTCVVPVTETSPMKSCAKPRVWLAWILRVGEVVCPA